MDGDRAYRMFFITKIIFYSNTLIRFSFFDQLLVKHGNKNGYPTW